MPSKVENALHEAVEAPLGSHRSRRPSTAAPAKTCILTFHDEGWCKQSVLVSPELFLPSQVRRTILRIVPARKILSDSPQEKETGIENRKRNKVPPNFVFALEQVSQDVLAGYPSLEVSILQPIATALGFANRSKITISEVEAEDHLASHVEIAFKDAYLTRADMWRLLTSDLVGTSIYRDQKVLFVNSVKASVKAIYSKGRRIQSALLDPTTKAIFRSDSSRYYLLLQMSREMWDFDSDGGGEIIFNKVINGFLPELFRRWEALGTSHSVSVVMFTRMEYDNHPAGLKHQDYYRVLTTELVSSEPATILNRLKKEFRTFLRDVSVSSSHEDEDEYFTRPDASSASPHGIIEGRPAAAIHGNILESLHTASIQFLRSNATCDLRRTGLSLIVITPGAGVFEVEHELLTRTTETLIENGIYIDLVCLSKMPLHSSPLFRYRVSGRSGRIQAGDRGRPDPFEEEWNYTIPHWVEVSFWQRNLGGDIYHMAGSRGTRSLGQRKKFVPRVRMYEIQMTGLMQNEFSISIPHLSCPHSVRFPNSFGLNAKAFKPKAALESYDLEGAKAVYNQGYKELDNHGSPEKSPSQRHMQPFMELLNWMDEHDEDVFKHAKEDPKVPDSHDQDTFSLKSPLSADSLAFSDRPKQQTVQQPSPVQQQGQDAPLLVLKRKASTASASSKFRASSAKLNPFARQFGPGFKGFGAAKAIATTQVSSEAVASNRLATDSSPEPSLSSKMPSSRIEHSFPASSTISRPSTRTSALSAVDSDTDPGASLLEKSRPIDIKSKPTKKPHTEVRDERELMENDTEMPPLGNFEMAHRNSDGVTNPKPPAHFTSPWMTMLNPSNPKSLTVDMTRRLGRWQHVFPKPTQTSTIKWKSLCSPACVPLTTEDFPSREQLRSGYLSVEYEVKVPKEKEASETEDFGEWLVRELIASRLTRGFSVVVGTRPAEALDLPQAQWYEFLHEKGMSEPGVKIIMSRGTEIHELFNVKKGVVKITRYLRSQDESLTRNNDQVADDYCPLIRTAYAKQYVRRRFSFLSKAAEIDWERLDRFVANDEEELNRPYPEPLQYWRARFVLIPIALSGARKRNHSSEDNEEEIRLEGIRKLTQMWQKNRYLSPNERKFESKARKDVNPLDIVYQTRSASAIVSELNDTILADSSESKSVQLLPEKELFEKAKFNVLSLAKTLQSDKGVRLMDRRWHWRLHYYCFIGLELTTWLVNNFRDIDTREEAVEFGNELMKEGLFVHVERRHNFRDGNFFYQITEKYRTPRQDTRSSWFGRLADRSVPPTPLVDSYSEEMKGLGPSLIASVSEGEEEEEVRSAGEEKEEEETAGEKLEKENVKQKMQAKLQKTSVMLSKQLLYDIDPRKKSHRRELVSLHIDRISSADDCYHLRIDWVTATPKLIEDAVESWATTAERSGLRLVEVPLLEAWRFTESHPFRHPYYIKLAKEPPQQPPHSAALEATSAGTRPSSTGGAIAAGTSTTVPGQTILLPQQQHSWPYHKAILKKFDFVLDVEAASDFPSEVSVQYSWGKPYYKLPQYVTRSGRLLAQITPDGRILLLINQLFNERGSAAREAQRAAAGAATTNTAAVVPTRPTTFGEALDTTQQTPRRTGTTPVPGSASGIGKLSLSPFSSPMLRAAAANAGADASQSPTLSNTTTADGTGMSGIHQQQAQPPLSRSELLNVTELRIELEAFCSDVQALERFYEEELHRPLATVPATPIVRPLSILTGVEEAASAIPPALSLKDDN